MTDFTILDLPVPIEAITERYGNKRDAIAAARKLGGNVYRQQSETGRGWVYFVTTKEED